MGLDLNIFLYYQSILWLTAQGHICCHQGNFEVTAQFGQATREREGGGADEMVHLLTAELTVYCPGQRITLVSNEGTRP